MQVKRIYINIFTNRVATFDCLFPSTYCELKLFLRSNQNYFVLDLLANFNQSWSNRCAIAILALMIHWKRNEGSILESDFFEREVFNILCLSRTVCVSKWKKRASYNIRNASFSCKFILLIYIYIFVIGLFKIF